MSLVEDEVRKTDLFKAIKDSGMNPRLKEGFIPHFIFTLPTPELALTAKTEMVKAQGFKDDEIQIDSSDISIGTLNSLAYVAPFVAALDKIYRHQVAHPTWLPIRKENKISLEHDASEVMEIPDIYVAPSGDPGRAKTPGTLEYGEKITTGRGFRNDTTPQR